MGAAANIQAALIAHLQERNTPLRSFSPTGFTFEICDPGHHAERQSRLVAEYAPVCNQH